MKGLKSQIKTFFFLQDAVNRGLTASLGVLCKSALLESRVSNKNLKVCLYLFITQIDSNEFSEDLMYCSSKSGSVV